MIVRTLNPTTVEILSLIPYRNPVNYSNVRIVLNVSIPIYVMDSLVYVIWVNNVHLLLKVLMLILVLVSVTTLQVISLAIILTFNGMLLDANVLVISLKIDLVTLFVLKGKYMMLKIVPVIWEMFLLIVVISDRWYLLEIVLEISPNSFSMVLNSSSKLEIPTILLSMILILYSWKISKISTCLRMDIKDLINL